MLMVSALRDGLLSGRAVVLADGVPGSVLERLEALGARVEVVPAGERLGEDEDRVGEWTRARAPVQAIVYDAGPTFADGGEAGLADALERGWVAIREVANGALIPGEELGKVVVLGPRPDAGPMADAARAGLESLARTLSVEWARHGVTAAMVAPGASSTDDEIAELVCFLVSPAGEYLSGCRLELGATSD
jgi:NAD(P)-dependent dehydrogenase (short-subunit alcohol dehydrogenase family)